ncbi:hypothetical protein V1477_000096 [Vespula maculifrons]|uniref:Uncharacterized protein n=1 Tax=Vespula maculifrons TaxID=7453 RepID=A0ABD2D2L0_VESMC
MPSRALYAHILFVRLGPIGAEIQQFIFHNLIFPKLRHLEEIQEVVIKLSLRTLCPYFSGSCWKTFVAPSTPIFCLPGSDQYEPRYSNLCKIKGKSLKILYLRNCATYRDVLEVVGKLSLRPLHAYFTLQDRTIRGRDKAIYVIF